MNHEKSIIGCLGHAYSCISFSNQNHKMQMIFKASFQQKVGETTKTILLVLFYYIFSIGLTFYNKWMFKNFHFPLMTTSIHFIAIFLLSFLSRLLFARYRSSTTTLEWKPYLRKVFLTGIASALDIGLSNWSFVFITVSLYTMVKSSCVVFILGFALVLKLEKPRFSLVFVVCLIAGGLFLFVFESSQFDLEGFLLVLSASFIGGIRWTFSQILTQKKELGLSNPIDLLYHLQPTMFIGLFPLAIAHEGLQFFTSKNVFGWETAGDVTFTIVIISVGGMFAFMLSFAEYLLLTNTSSLTLSISGIFKEIITLIIATTYNKNHLSPLNWVGFFICVSGISLHVLLKFYRGKADESTDTNDQLQMKLLNHDFSDTDSEAELFDINKR